MIEINFLKNILKKLKFKKKLIIFDLDGVLIDSKINMKFAWQGAKNRYNLDTSFNEYFQNIGKPFTKILDNLNILSNQKRIEKEFFSQSIKHFNKIKVYKNVKYLLNHLKKRGVISAIVTSKDFIRTKKILKYLNLKVNFIQCPEKNLKGKPFPDQLLKVIKKTKVKKKNCIYIGDTIFDKKAALAAGIDFALALYGYKIGIKKSKISLKNILDIKKII